MYDVKDEDFSRLITLHKIEGKQGGEIGAEDVEEYFEEIGDIDPKLILAINQ